jgi:hypothetical protein
MKRRLFTFSSAIGVLLLTACGGGDGGGDSPTTAPAPKEFQVRTAYLNKLTMSSGVKKFKLTGNLVERGLTESISGDGTEDVGVATAATLGSMPTQKITTVVRGSAVVANRNVSLDSIKEMHLDSNNNPVALISNEYNDENGYLYLLITSITPIPQTARINDSGNLYAANRYRTNTSTGSTLVGTYVASYAIQEDTATTALFVLTGTLKDTAGKTLMTETERYRMTQSGTVAKISKTVVSYSSNFTAVTTLNTSY